MIGNIIAIHKQAQPPEFTAGLQWYHLAREHAERISQLGVTLEQAAYVIAALSPRTAWNHNLATAWSIVKHWKAGGDVDNYDKTGCRALPLNISKAFAILDGNLSVLSGNKVTAFADNILYPSASKRVTVDSWATRIAWGLVTVNDEIGRHPTPKEYREISAAYQAVAGFVGLLPLEVQAITWVVSHRLEGKVL